MKISDRHLGYLVLAGIMLVLTATFIYSTNPNPPSSPSVASKANSSPPSIKLLAQIAFARQLENILLDKLSLDTHVAVVKGKDALLIKGAKIDRALAYHLMKEGALVQSARNFGFKEIDFYNPNTVQFWKYDIKLPSKQKTSPKFADRDIVQMSKGSPADKITYKDIAYLRKAFAFQDINYKIDAEMRNCARRIKNESISSSEFWRIIKHCHSLFDKAFSDFKKASPPSEYLKAHINVLHYANLRAAAFKEILLFNRDHRANHIMDGFAQFFKSKGQSPYGQGIL